MTGGVVVMLGPVGRNVGAGMTGGVVYVWDPDHTAPGRLADSAPPAQRFESQDAATLRRLAEEHVSLTGSRRVRSMLRSWDAVVAACWVLRASPPQPAPVVEEPAAVGVATTRA